MAEMIHCPNCNVEIEVSTALASELREHMRKEYDAELRRRESDFTLKDQELREREREIEASRQSLDDELNRRLSAERQRVLQEARTQAQAAVGIEFQDLQEQLADSRRKLEDTEKVELQLRKERRQLEGEKQALELTVSRTLDEERAKIRDQATRDADEQHRLKEADKDKMIGDLRLQIDDLKRKSEQGSQQAQGEVMEVMLRDILQQAFPLDSIEDVPVGVHGGDLVHGVFDPTGEECGRILWESKRTKSWHDSWLPKLRDDQRAAKAHLAILVTAEMPKGFGSFGCVDGVWITKRECLVGLAVALRAGLLEIARTRRSLQGHQTKMEFLYQFLVGPEFQHRIEGIIEAFATMKEDLDSERRSVHRLWSKREKQLDRAMINTSGLYGDLASILGTSLPQIDCLELTHIPVEAGETIVEKAPWD